jgi:two-component system sensor histidine kinase/response regulator
MAGLDARATTRRIRQDLGLNHLPVIAMTAHAAQGGKAVCIHAGMNDHVMKPFEPQALLDVLARWLEAAPDAISDPVAQVVDFHVGMRRCMGKVDLYRRIASRFLDAKGREVAQIRAALLDGEHARAANLAHQLISSAGTLGAEGLAQAARTLQLAVLEDRVDTLPAQLQALETQFHDVLRALQAHLSRLDRAAQTTGTPPDMHEPSI